MPLDFPTSPTLNQTYSLGNKTWSWNGAGWQLVPNQVQGIQGAQGLANQGVQGLAGTSQGTQGTQGLGSQGLQGTLGGSAGFPYTFSTTLTASDPGTGFFRFNSATTGSITEMYISDLDTNSVDRSSALLTLDDTAGTDRARIYLPVGSTGFTVSLTVTGTITDNTTWLTIPVSFTSGALPSNNELRSVVGVRNGIQGVAGSAQGTQGLQGTFGPATIPESTDTFGSGDTIVAADNGKLVSFASSITIANVFSTDGQNVVIYNNSAGIGTVFVGAGITMRLAGTAQTGTRYMQQRGLATIIVVNASVSGTPPAEYVISGAGVT